MPEPLWVCHRCKMIGDGFEAGRHVEATMHPVDQLSPELSEAVRAELVEQRRHDSAQRIAGIIAYTKLVAG